jgi:hypothetical protein
VRKLLCVFKTINIEKTEDWQYSADWMLCRRKIQDGSMSLIFTVIRIFVCLVVNILRQLASYVLAGFDVLTLVLLNITALCVSTPCRLEDWLVIKIKTILSFDTSVTAHQFKRRIFSEDLNVYCKLFSCYVGCTVKCNVSQHNLCKNIA